MTIDVGLRIRVDDQLKSEFIQVCRQEDTTAAQAIRCFMRIYIKERSEKNDSDGYTQIVDTLTKEEKN